MMRGVLVCVGLLAFWVGAAAAQTARTRTYTKSTIVDADDGKLVLDLDEIVLKDGVNLTIVAGTLVVRRGVKIVGVGAVGPKGRSGMHGTWSPSGRRQAEEIRAACPRTGPNVAECACDGDYVAGPGGEGGAGSRIVIVAQHVTWVPRQRVIVDVTGGLRGAPGDPGIKTCAWNGHQCSSPPCTSGAPRQAGPSGSLKLRLGHKAFLDHVVASALLPPSSIDAALAQTKASFEAAAKDARGAASAEKSDALTRF